MAIVRCLIARHHNSAPTASSDGAWDRGVGPSLVSVGRFTAMSEVPIHVGLKPRWKDSFLQVSCKPLLTFASRCEDATVELCNTKALRLLRSRKRPENGAPGSLERTASL